MGVEVNPNHGLWAFFRKRVGKDGVLSYETLEAKDSVVDYSGTFLPITWVWDFVLCVLYTRAELRIVCFPPAFM